MNLNIIKKTILAIAILLLVSPVVLAESGTILISSEYNRLEVPPGQVYDSNGFPSVYSPRFLFNTTTYTDIIVVREQLEGYTYPYEFNSSSFIITAGGTGTGSVYMYRSTNNITYIFDRDNTYTGAQINISLSSPFFHFFGTTGAGRSQFSCSVSATYPVSILDNFGEAGSSCGNLNYQRVDSNAVDTYSVDYPIPGYFRLNVTKNPFINSTYSILSYDGTQQYFKESTSNKNSITGALIEYGNGISLNTTLLNGDYFRTVINSSGAAAATGTGNIRFNRSSYNLYDEFNISWNINNLNVNEDYGMTVYRNSNNQVQWTQQIVSSASYSAFDTTIGLQNPDDSGLYTVELFKVSYPGGVATEAILDTDTIYYGTDTTQTVAGNFTITNSPVFAGNVLNLTYNASASVRLDVYDSKNHVYYYIPKNNSAKYQIYIPQLFKIGVSSVKMEYFDVNSSAYDLLYWQSFIVKPADAFSLTVEKNSYTQGELIKFYPYSTQIGYAHIKNPSGQIVNNISISASGMHTLAFQTTTGDEAGIYTAYLFNATEQIISKTTNLNYGMQTAIPTVAGTATSTPVTLIDISSELSEGILGKLDANSDGLNSNAELSGFGNKILSTMILIVIVLLISGIFSRKR